MAEDFDLEFGGGRKKKPREEQRPTDLGPLMFAALAIILLAFFILLVSMATIDSSKRIEALGSLLGTFGALGGGISPKPGEMVGRGGVRTASQRFIASLSLFQELVKARGLEKEILLQGGFKGFTISLSSGVMFGPGAGELLPKSYVLLDTVKFIIADGQKRFRVRIEGHTDDLPFSNARYESNWELSVARAISVLRYILRDTGIKGDQLEAVGFAEFRPKSKNDSPENRARNRRVDIVFLSKKPPRDLDPKKVIDVKGFKFTF
ncbi:MAG: flagellar motor protein MotB [bacterium]